MRGVLIVATAAALTATGTGLGPGAGSAFGAPAPERASLQGFLCHRSLRPSRRVVSVTAVMRSVPGTSRLAMRFQLRVRTADGSSFLRGSDLGSWIHPTPITLGELPADVWIVHHPVKGVPVPAVYRFRVSFRWLDASGRTIASAVRWSPNCWQPDMRPDLLVKSIDVIPVPGTLGEDEYDALLANIGLSTARSVEVLFSPGGGAPGQTITLAELPSHSIRVLRFIGGPCTSAATPTVTIDPEHRIDVIDPGHESLAASCPAPGRATTGSAGG